MPTSATPIGIAVVEHDERYLVGTRRDDAPLPGLAEFPGGKCHPGETPKDCVVRECWEETGLEVAAVELLLSRSYRYDHDTLDLHFWLCRPVCPQQVCKEMRGFCWVPVGELGSLTFPEANGPVISRLVALSQEGLRQLIPESQPGGVGTKQGMSQR